MTLKNPENGSTIKTIVDGKEWFFPKDTTASFPDEVGKQLLTIFGFLEEILNQEPAVAQEIAEGFKCSVCDYQNKVKVAVLGHIKSHKTPVVTEAKPVGDAKKSPTLYEERNARQQQFNPDKDLERQFPGVEFYGEGFEERRGFGKSESTFTAGDLNVN